MRADDVLGSFPEHDGGDWQPMPHEVVARWPAGAFAENVAVDAAGAVFVSLHGLGRIDRFDPATDTCAPFAETPAAVAGLAFDAEGTLWATGGAIGEAPGRVWRITPAGEVVDWLMVDDALFMNGCTPLGDGRTLLVCESLTGRVLAVDLCERVWRPWLADARLRPTDPQLPGANGIKMFRQAAYVSVTSANAIYRVAVTAGGEPAALEPFATTLRGDDFAFAEGGALFVATHPAQSVVRVAPDGGRVTVAGPEEGVVGSTACAFGRAPGDERSLYVTTNGGTYRPHEGLMQDAKLVRLLVGEPGAALPA